MPAFLSCREYPVQPGDTEEVPACGEILERCCKRYASKPEASAKTAECKLAVRLRVDVNSLGEQPYFQSVLAVGMPRQ